MNRRVKSKYDNSKYIGKQYGKLIIQRYLNSKDPENNQKYPAFLCKCSCENIVAKKANLVIAGKIKSCGECTRLFNSKYNNPDYIGKTFGELTIKKFLASDDIQNTEHAVAFLCECKCKRIVIKKASHVINGKIKSCGKCNRAN